MSNPIFLFQNQLIFHRDTPISITASNSDTATPPTFLQDQQPARFWKTANLDDAVIRIDFGGVNVRMDTFAFIGTNARQTSTWRIRLATAGNNPVTQPIADSAAQSMWVDSWQGLEERPSAFFRFPQVLEVGEVQIDIDPGVTGSGYFLGGTLMMGEAWVPACGAQSYKYAPEDLTETTLMMSGITRVRGLPKIKKMDLQFNLLNQADAHQIYQMATQVGSRYAILAHVDPEDPNYSGSKMIYGWAAMPNPPIHRQFYQGHRTSMRITQI